MEEAEEAAAAREAVTQSRGLGAGGEHAPGPPVPAPTAAADTPTIRNCLPVRVARLCTAAVASQPAAAAVAAACSRRVLLEPGLLAVAAAVRWGMAVVAVAGRSRAQRSRRGRGQWGGSQGHPLLRGRRRLLRGVRGRKSGCVMRFS